VTIKQKRAQALRKVSGREAAGGYLSGALVDPSFSESDVRAALGPLSRTIDWQQFSDFLGDQLGLFRDLSERLPPAHVERKLAEELLEAVAQLQKRMQHLPPRLEANLYLHCHKRQARLFSTFRDQLDASLQEAWHLVDLADRDLVDGEVGRPRASALYRLLHAVARHIKHTTKVGKEQAATIAGDVLRACHVDAPTDAKDLRRIVRAMEQGGENSA
jgi:hypothetical protein